MEGDRDIIGLLNEQLTAELTAINQYFLHAKMQDNWGFTRLARHTRAESFDEMRHAERLTDRIAFSQQPPLRLVQCTRCETVYRNPRERAFEVTVTTRHFCWA